MSPESHSRLELRATGAECAGFRPTRWLFTILTRGIYGFWLASKTYVHGHPLVFRTSFADFALAQIVKIAMLMGTCGFYMPWHITVARYLTFVDSSNRDLVLATQRSKGCQ